MQAEQLFPYATAAFLYLSAVIAYMIYRRTGFEASLILFLGILAVATQSVMDGYISGRLIGWGGWDNVPSAELRFLLFLDGVRGVLIMAWAAAEVLFVLELANRRGTVEYFVAPLSILVGGILWTFMTNFSGIEPVSTRILLSSAGRVLGILVPVALLVGAYILVKMWRVTRDPASLSMGVGFIIHGVTLPLYTVAKETGALTLGLWYAFGGVIPSALLVLGLYLLTRQA